MKLYADSRYKLGIIKRDGFGCKLCGCMEMKKLTVDHIIPIAAFGRKGSRKAIKLSNLQILCITCHKEKDKEVGIKYPEGRQKFRRKSWYWPGNKPPKII